ncbi:hypothetical protein, partial [Rothia nasisuis]|uniref:hypothetical protein n=1 Tax=Rothia nasisuis TaxID=2109647 RepID=UPI001F26BFF0
YQFNFRTTRTPVRTGVCSVDDKNVIYNIGTLLSFQATDHTPPSLPLVAFHPVFLVGAHAGLN